jgi:hypothetical protein
LRPDIQDALNSPRQHESREAEMSYQVEQAGHVDALI